MGERSYASSASGAGRNRRVRRRGQALRRVPVLAIALAVVGAAVFVARADGEGRPPAGTAGTAASGASSAQTSTTQPPPAVWVAAKSRIVRVWVGGDSLGGELVWGLTPLLKQAGAFTTTTYYRESSGICRYDFMDWGKKMAAVMSTTRPHAVAIMLGTNDTQSVWTSGGWIAYGTSAWKRAYERRVGALMDVMLKDGARRVYWVGMPIMRESWRNARMRLINTVFRTQAEKRPGVRYIDIWPLYSDANGRYVAKWRGYDGVHFTTAGWQRLGGYVYGSIKADWLP